MARDVHITAGSELVDDTGVKLGSSALADGPSIAVVDAGSDLATERPSGAGAVYWLFDNGVDVGTDGANVTNGVAGDMYYVRPAS